MPDRTTDPIAAAPDADSRHPARRIRTFHARHGRVTTSMRDALATIGPRRSLEAHDPARPLVLEIGCGHGEAAMAFARRHPEVDVIAIDVHTPGVARLLQRADDAGLPNLLVEHGDAVEVVDERIPPGTLAGVHVFFPDPWPKTRHHKRRLIRPDVLDLLADRMRPGATLLVASDVVDYADWARDHLDAHAAFEGGPARRPDWRPDTGYEAKALAAGRQPIDLRYHRVRPVGECPTKSS